MRRIPILSTLVVLAAVGVMITLGFWQLRRLAEKEALLAHYSEAQSDLQPLAQMPDNSDLSRFLYRTVRVRCSAVTGWESVAGTNADGEAGIAHIALCKSGAGIASNRRDIDIAVNIGWSRDPSNPKWQGGDLTGTIAPFRNGQAKIVAAPPLAGLQPNAKPDPADIPNNHLSYAIQWFLFAATALVIYAIALWKRLAKAA